MDKSIENLPREKLLELITIFAKNWLALDGVWFQSIEEKSGMDEAMEHDLHAWRRYAVIEAKRIKEFLDLPEKAGLEGLRLALNFRVYSRLNSAETCIEGNQLIYNVTSCRVQAARARKGMPYHPCKPVGLVEYAGFARSIDARITTECLSCYPEVVRPESNCVWKFTLNETDEPR